jgi:uncharacterized phage protein (TIGR01671 family)
MESRYLFRGVKKDCGGIIEFATGYLIPSQNEKYPDRIVDKCFEYDVIKETISQCTGLKDKNGVLIFEGDKVSISGLSPITIKWDVDSYEGDQNNWGSFSVGFSFGMFTDELQLEVVGNIHDE